MLRSTQEMKNYAIGATDGEIGHVVDLLQQTVKDSPRFESSAALNRQQEADLHKHYKRSAYWEKEQRLNEMTAAQD